MLVTLYLIASNVYSSVEAPKSRGFSYIEKWMIGIHIPLLTAIFEYGIILAMKKYQHKIKKPTVIKNNARVSEENEHNEMYPAMALKESDGQKNIFDVEKMAKLMDKWNFIGSLTFIVCFDIIYWATLASVAH